jgi:hypothetical protein
MSLLLLYSVGISVFLSQITLIGFLIFELRSTQRLALLALGRAAGRLPIRKMIRRRKILENAAESPASSARFVSQRGLRIDTIINDYDA